MKPPRRVLLMVRELGPGGSERQLTELAKALDRAAIEPHVGYFRDGPRGQELRALQVPLLQLPVTSFMSPSALAGAFIMARYLRQHRIEIVHTFDYPLNCFGVPVARFAGAPAVLSSQRADRRLNPKLYQMLLRATDRLVDGVVVNCEYVRRHLIERERVPATRIRLCYNGIDVARFYPAPRRRPPELNGASLTIGVVCVLRPEKDLPTLLTAFAMVARGRPGIRLVIVGSGPEQERLRQQARELGIEPQSIFVPSTPEVTEWLHAIDIFVLPSRSEAFSNSLMEAMACGCAAVASDVGGNPELVAHGETGLIFRAGDAQDLARQLETLIESEPGRERLAEAAAARIRSRFSVSSSARDMAAIYEEFAPAR
jgi:L-malate glycosyltransferase